MTATYSSQVRGDPAQDFAGTMRTQLKPTLLVEVAMNVVSGRTQQLTEILTGKAVYLKTATLSKETGKPWAEIPYSGMKGNRGEVVRQLVQSVQNDSLAQQARMVSASRNVHVIGTQVVDGIRTTEYAGSYTAAAALALLSPGERQTLGPNLKEIHGQIRFTEWIGSQHDVRKAIVIATLNGEQLTQIFNVTAVNNPVHILLPRRRRVALLPAGAL